MKTYEPRRNNACPNGLHPDYNPDLDPSLNECTCPWLIIQSSTPVQHITSWNRRETENVIREMDRGYFDPPGYPQRTGSMFLSPAMQRLIDVAEKEPVAAALTLLAGAGSGLPPFDAIAWDAEDACLSLRVPGLGWRRLWLGHANVDAMTDSDFTTAGGANPVLLWADHPDTAEDTGLPEGLVAAPHEVSGDVYAEDILNLDGTPALPVYDEAVRAPGGTYTGPPIQVGEDGCTLAVPIRPAIYPPELEAQVRETINNPDSRVRRERPLPRRVPQVPSEIAAAGYVNPEDYAIGQHMDEPPRYAPDVID